jgi:long-chain acyl-CoA synthetase
MHEANVIERGAQAPLPGGIPSSLADRASERPWLASYPPGIPAEIDVPSLGTLVSLFEGSVAAFAERPAMLCFGSTMTYATLGQQARDLAAWLQSQGLAKGDRVAIMLPNVPAYAVAIFGVLLAGGTVVNTNPLYTPREFTQQINDSGARILIVLENFGATVAAALPDVTLDRVALVGPGDGLGLKGQVINLASRHVRKAVPPFRLPDGLAVPFATVLRRGRGLPRAAATVEQDDLAFLQYTGGTTGIAKAAMLTHSNIMANVEQSQLWFGSKDPSVLRCAVTALPLYHIFALTACFFQFMRNGGSCLLIPNPRDCDGMVKTLSRTRFTCLMGVNTLFNVLINHPKIGTVDFSQLDFVVGGGTAVQRSVAERWKVLTGSTIIEGYGLSETSPVVSVNPCGLNAFSGTIGYP